MNLNREMSSVTKSCFPGSNILGATGLSPACLRRVFSTRGLFGAGSTLTGLEQATVYAELQLSAGAVPPLPASEEVPNHWRLGLIRALVREILRQDIHRYERQAQFARRFGVPGDVLSEVTRTVRTAMLVYGAGAPVQQEVEVATVTPTQGANDGFALCASA